MDGNITINQLKRLSEGIGYDFTCALVPKTDINTLIDGRAENLAKHQLESNAQYMYLEGQSISAEKQAFLHSALKKSLLEDCSHVLWLNESWK